MPKIYKSICVSVLIGLGIVGIAFFPALNPPQCEGTQTQDCIVGANIGQGLVLYFGFIVIAVSLLLALLFYLSTFIKSIYHKK